MKRSPTTVLCAPTIIESFRNTYGKFCIDQHKIDKDGNHVFLLNDAKMDKLAKESGLPIHNAELNA